MRLIANWCLRFATGRSEFVGWYKNGTVRARNLSREVGPGEVFELPDHEALELIKTGSATVVRAEYADDE